ncbi:unnamed protein product [Thelazia callipaeda]|uniref:SURP motif domain-containing protein n=1 Tax=Thelazia callipaeda TaxID=103827 RepID=A0A0N5D624_THECL|nr:unnamed protein product [Thelazia callipaeda]
MENLKLARGKKRRDIDDDQLFVFGYASRVYANDERAEWVAEERHLIAHPSDSGLLIDRYDCRLYLSNKETMNSITKGNSETSTCDCPAEMLEEEMCEEERYKDMHEDIRKIQQEEEEKRTRVKIAFNYDEAKMENIGDSDDEETDEPFQPPGSIKLPLGMNLPDTMKENAVIERTATFVVAQGPQMEIVIKAKQRGNQDQFGFLEFDHPLNAYYKYISKLIREKKYEPKLHIPKRSKHDKEEKSSIKEHENEKEESIDWDSDSDFGSDNGGSYLHPLLTGGSQKSISSNDFPVMGPKTKEENDITFKPIQLKTGYKLGKADDMYSSLFKNLSDLLVTQGKTIQNVNKNKDLEKGDYYEWYLAFYGEPPPSNEQPNVIPPPPDIMPTINSAAGYVAKYGMQAEQLLLGRNDLNIGFLHVNDPYYGYYHSKIRFFQNLDKCSSQSQMKRSLYLLLFASLWLSGLMIIIGKLESEELCDIDSSKEQSEPSTSEGLSTELQVPSTTQLNRKMRRRGFHDPPCAHDLPIQNVAEIGVVDVDVQLTKVHSSPALLESVGKQEDASVKKIGMGPISFSLNIQKTDERVPKIASAVKLGVDDDDEDGEAEAVDVPPGVLSNLPPPGLTIPPPPVAPIPLSSGQLAVEGSAELQSERKLKARLFMEKILNEKRAAKLRAHNEEQMKRENELLRKYEETRGISGSSSLANKSNTGSAMNEVEMIFSTSAIDQLINSQIDKVITEALKERQI